MPIRGTGHAGEICDIIEVRATMWRSRLVIGFAVISGALASTRADLPLGPPHDYEVRSPNGRYLAKITVDPGQTRIYSIENGVEMLKLSMDGFHREVSVANDGDHLVIAYSDLVWAASERTPSRKVEDMPILRFIERGRLVREVKLRELIDPRRMIRTASSWHWGFALPGLTDQNEFVVHTVDYRQLHFDVESGRLIRTEIFYRNGFGTCSCRSGA